MGSLPTPEAAAGKEGGGSGPSTALAADGGGGGRVGAEAMRRLFDAQRRHIEHFFEHLRHEEVAAFAQELVEAEGSMFFSGVGKSGFVARKIAHTLSSVGFPRASFLHPVDALHGDLGAVGRGDVVVVLSKSGASEELLRLVPCARAKGARIAAVTSVAGSALARAADLSVHLPLERELCPFDLAPVTSAAVQMLFGDTVAVALMEASGLTLEKYASNHPAGRIGKSLIFKVKDVMKKQPELPLCKEGDLIVEQLVELTSKGCGCLLVVDENNCLIGTFTDGDLRRALKANGEAIFKLSVGGVCNRKPRTIAADAMAVDAMRKMEAPPSPVQFLPVVDSEGHVIGIVTLHGLVSAGL